MGSPGALGRGRTRFVIKPSSSDLQNTLYVTKSGWSNKLTTKIVRFHDRRPRAGTARGLGSLRGAAAVSLRGQGLHLAGGDVPGRAAGRLLPYRMGASAAEPERVLRPPRGRAPSQRPRSPRARARHGRGPVAQRRRGALVPHTAAARDRP